MLTLAHLVVVENFAKDVVAMVKDAIVNKPIKRVSRRKVKGKYVDKVFYSPVNASGDLARSIRYEITDTSMSIWANDYIYDLIFGKAPMRSAMDADLGLEKKIKDWASVKGITAENGNEDTMAYYMKRKIDRFGSSIYLATHGKNSGLLENIISKPLIDAYNRKFENEIKKEFKAIFTDGN